MALKRLTAQEMIQVSTPWVTVDDPARLVLNKVSALAALVPQLEAAHRAIFSLQLEAGDPKAKKLSVNEAELDATHDALVRGIYVSLSTIAEFSPSGEELLRLRDLLLPDGLEHARKTYRGEAGHAALIGSRLDDALRARLGRVALHDKSLLDLVDAWLEAASKLGALEEERARLDDPSTKTAGQINAARIGWVRVVNALVTIAELSSLDADSDRVLFSALRAAEHTADNRRRSKREPISPAVEAPTSAS